MEKTDKRQEVKSGWKIKMHEIIFEADTSGGKTFDIILLVSIIISVLIVMLDSVPGIKKDYGKILFLSEWIFTILFTIEYFLRIISIKKSFKYIFSFYGIIDLLSIIPTYFSLVLLGSQYLVVIRTFRLLRIFRVLKLGRFLKASAVLTTSLKASKHKIAVFLGVVFTTVIIMGSFMYLIEGPESGFTSIPRGIYWAIVTLTTVGYGDIAPITVFGQGLASVVMVLGYAIIAVPTGIITIEMAKVTEIEKSMINTQVCNNCNHSYHDDDAKFCKNCGTNLNISTGRNN